jgi:CBS domain-containing protein
MFSPQTSEYLIRRQRKDVLENLGRVAVVGMSTEPIFKSYGLTQKLIQYGVKILPVIPNCAAILSLPCYERLEDVPGSIDVVQVYRQPGLDLLAVAQAAIDKKAKVFWVENDDVPEAVRQRLAEAKVFVVEHESLEAEYRRHCLAFTPEPGSVKSKPAATVSECMTRDPVTVKVNESVQDAVTKMKRGHFRHLPVVGSDKRLIGMLSDRDLRLIRPFSSYVPYEAMAEQLATISVEEVAVFSPVAIMHDASLEEAAELMLRWGVGGLPVLSGDSHLVGIITYADLLREFLTLSRRSAPLPQRLRAG